MSPYNPTFSFRLPAPLIEYSRTGGRPDDGLEWPRPGMAVRHRMLREAGNAPLRRSGKPSATSQRRRPRRRTGQFPSAEATRAGVRAARRTRGARRPPRTTGLWKVILGRISTPTAVPPRLEPAGGAGGWSRRCGAGGVPFVRPLGRVAFACLCFACQPNAWAVRGAPSHSRPACCCSPCSTSPFRLHRQPVQEWTSRF